MKYYKNYLIFTIYVMLKQCLLTCMKYVNTINTLDNSKMSSVIKINKVFQNLPKFDCLKRIPCFP